MKKNKRASAVSPGIEKMEHAAGRESGTDKVPRDRVHGREGTSFDEGWTANCGL